MYYRIISRFICNGSDMVVVKLRNCVHVIKMEEWRKIYGRNTWTGGIKLQPWYGI